MSVVIRLSRGGRSHLPAYDIVVSDSRRARDGKFIERLGFHHPKARGEEVAFQLNEAKLTEWVGKGAQVSGAVTRLLIKHNLGPAKVKEAFQAYKLRRAKAQEVTRAAADRLAKGKEANDAAPAAPAVAPVEAAAPAAESAPAGAPAPETAA
jgi:small subunit ribosomal protein S16